MNSKEYSMIFQETFTDCQKLGATKGREYRGREGEENVLANFDRLSMKLGVDPMVVIMVYLTKHLDSIDTYVRDWNKPVRHVMSEPIEGRINDAINYLILLKADIIRVEAEARKHRNLPKAMQQGAEKWPSADSLVLNRNESAGAAKAAPSGVSTARVQEERPEKAETQLDRRLTSRDRDPDGSWRGPGQGRDYRAGYDDPIPT